MRRATNPAILFLVGLTVLAKPAAAIDILLTNDDGFDAPGIVALQAALKAAGNKVTVVAPSGNRSGSSTALTFTSFGVTKPASGVYSVDSSPATTVLFGVSVVFPKNNPPDLIVSGVNTGPSTVISGTVGNVIAGITQLNRPIPGVAFSTNLVDATGPATSPANVKHFEDVAKFAVRLVGRLAKAGVVKALPRGYGLNVNYPGIAPAKTLGVRFATQGFALSFPPAFAQITPGVWQSSSVPVTPTHDVRRSDVILLNRGFVTIVPIDANYTAEPWLFRNLQPVLGGLNP